MNVFLWAYQDDRLPVKRADGKKARNYLRALLELGLESETFKESAKADLAVDALSMNPPMRVFAFDARHSYADVASLSDEIDALFQAESKKRHQSPESLQQELRLHPEKLQGLDNEQLAMAWMARELEILLTANPEYRKRLQIIERIIEKGKVLGIDEDVLSATLFNAASVPDQNSIAIIGALHIAGFQTRKGKGYTPIGGTFDRHLALLQSEGRAAPRVTSAIVAGTAEQLVAETWDIVARDGVYSDLNVRDASCLKTGPLTVIPLDGKPPSRLIQPPLKNDAKGFSESFSGPHANPLLVPEIAQDSKELGKMLNGTERAFTR